jgi:hypothetical protein
MKLDKIFENILTMSAFSILTLEKENVILSIRYLVLPVIYE